MVTQAKRHRTTLAHADSRHAPVSETTCSRMSGFMTKSKIDERQQIRFARHLLFSTSWGLHRMEAI